jgi:hypothetical protein
LQRLPDVYSQMAAITQMKKATLKQTDGRVFMADLRNRHHLRTTSTKRTVWSRFDHKLSVPARPE